MIRITRFQTSRDLTPPDGIQAVEAARQAAEAVQKVRGVRSCRLYLSRGNLVFVSEAENYAVADAALADSAVQASFGRLGAEFGYRPADDEFLMDIEQVMPFLKR